MHLPPRLLPFALLWTTLLLILRVSGASAQASLAYEVAATAPGSEWTCTMHAECGEAGYCDDGTCRTRPAQHRKGLLVAGPVIAAASFGVNGLIGMFAGTHLSFWSSGPPDDPGWEAFRATGWIPIVGPWVQLAVKPTSIDVDDWALYLTLNALLQAAGWSMLIGGLTMDSGGDPLPRIAVLPSAGSDQFGLQAIGSW